ncbi:MAG TPA: alpha/beta fold hydrolase [Acidimicrobiales bacterium]|nr:alpha/beta fold hydrolase [Acidimicrobiales bacterium]
MRTRDERLRNEVQHPDRYKEITIESGGVPIVLSVWRGAPRAPTVVFFSGTMGHPLFHEEFLDCLNQAGFSVVGLHPQSHGKSPRVRRTLRWSDLVRNAIDTVEWASHRFDGPLVAVGSSQGGILATTVASRCPQLAAVFARNTVDPRLPQTIEITSFPRWLRPVYRPLLVIVDGLARVAPRLPIPLGLYLDLDRVCRDPWTKEQFLLDPLLLRSYPLRFLADLITADASGMTDGSISCPVVIMASTGDRVFPYSYMELIFERLVAPKKELMTFETDSHLLFHEELPMVLPRLVAKVAELAGEPTGNQ